MPRFRTDQVDRPLTRGDVEQLLVTSGGSAALNLSDANLQDIDLHGMNLSGAVLTRANLTGANLIGTELTNADLRGARLRNARLERAILDGATLDNADLWHANLEGASLVGARLARAWLIGAQLSRAVLNAADLTGAFLNSAVVKETDLRNANLRSVRANYAALSEALLEGTEFDDESMVDPRQRRRLAERGAHVPSEWLRERRVEPPHPWSLQLRIDQERLTARNLATIVSSLHDLHAKSMLLYMGLDADLAKYALTRDTDLVDELDLVITSISQHSPTEIKVDISPESVGKAVAVAVDSIATIGHRRKEYDLRNRELEQDIEIKREQAREELARAEQERTLERERAELQFERERLQIERERFGARMERYNLAVETASTLVRQLRPGLSDGEREMAIQLMLPTLLQLEQADGLALVPGTKDRNDSP